MTDTFSTTTERNMALSAHQLYKAWTEQFDVWFAVPDSVRMTAQQGQPFFFETEFQGTRHPHYGRFLDLVPDSKVELTWVTGVGGTEGAETVVRVQLTEVGENRAHVVVDHSGFHTSHQRDQHGQSWPLVLDQMEQRLTAG